MASEQQQQAKYRVWWIPQVPMHPFYVYVSVPSPEVGHMILSILADYDIFQCENNIKPDYSNAGGLEVLDLNDMEDSPEGSWIEWEDEDGFDVWQHEWED
jgi:hypothetical protein